MQVNSLNRQMIQRSRRQRQSMTVAGRTLQLTRVAKARALGVSCLDWFLRLKARRRDHGRQVMGVMVV